MSRITLAEAGIDFGIPRPGWPGRGLAIAIAAAKVAGLLVFLLLGLAACQGAILLVWAMQL